MGTSHTVSQGETLISIAQQHGFRDWRVIYYDDANAELRRKRPNPMVLFAGDTVVIPEKKVAEFKVETNQAHTFQLKPLEAYLCIQLQDEEGIPYANRRYRVEVDGKAYQEHRTDDDGMVKEAVPPDAKTAKITLWPDDADATATLEWTLELGHLDPVEELTGVRDRLNLLGYPAGTEDAVDETKLKEALRQFQEDHGLPATGEPDGPTRAALREATKV